MSEENQRENDCLTLHAADLLPVETSWRGMPQSPLILLDTPHRQLVPFSLWDSSFADANMLIMAASGGGKTFMAMLFLLMMARLKPLISILERGDSYRPLVELMGGRCIDVDLEGSITLNPWDLAPGATTPGKDKIAFLKNLTRHMIGDSPNSDTALLDNLLSEAISRTYKRCAIRHSNPTPTFNDLREELQQWRDEERIERTVEEAKLAALKLREWTGERGVYSRLFDQHTTLKTDADWLFFNVERLSDDPRLETAMSMMIAHAMQERASGEPANTVSRFSTSAGHCSTPTSGSRSGAVVPDGPQTRRKRVGHFADAGRLRRNRHAAADPRSRHCAQRLDENHRPAAGRREPASDSPGI